MDRNFNRVSLLPPYVFAEVNKLKALLRSNGKDVVDLGMGNPDADPPVAVIEKLVDTVKRSGVHGYSTSIGIKGLRKAFAQYYKKRFDVDLDPVDEVIATLGSKEGFASLAMAITSPGDVFLVPDPAYPIHPYGFVIAGGSVRHVQCMVDGRFDEETYFRALTEAVMDSMPRPKALVVNFPSNPTAHCVDLRFYKRLVEFAKNHQIWVISDLAYAEVYFGDERPPSILQIPGAKDVAIEFSSLSKTFSMAGWRVGFAAGNKDLIAALAKIKSYLDYGAYTPIQVAAVTALSADDDYVSEMRAIYRERRDVVVSGLASAGWSVASPSASMFIWAKMPDRFLSMGSLEFSKMLLTEAGVAVAPGIGFGQLGEGFVRIALVENPHRLRQACREVKRFLAT